MFKRKDYTIPLVAVLGLIGIMTLLFSTRWGIGISPDSTVYICAARSLLNGVGLSVLSGSGKPIPMTHYPPLFPTTLSMIGIFGIDPLNGARWLNAFLFGTNILLVGLVINKYTRSIWPTIFGSFLMLSSISMLRIHSMAWTEPLFIFFALLGLFLLAAYMENPKLLLLMASSGAIALAFLTRYIGAVLVITGIVGIFFLSRKSRKTWYGRLGDSAIFVVISSFPMAIWMVRNLYIAGSATNREIVWHPITSGYFKPAMSTLSTWLLLGRGPGIIRGIHFLVVVAGLLVLSILLLQRKRRLNTGESNRQYLAKMPFLLVTFLFFYGMFLIVSISLFDAYIALYNRTLSPIYVSGLVFILCLAYRLLDSTEGVRALKVASIVICVALIVSYEIRAAIWAIHSHRGGQGYAGRGWQHSEIVGRVRALPSGIPIFTNGVDAIYILTGRPAWGIPSKVRASTRQVNNSYLSELARMRDQLENSGGVLVYFNTIKRCYFPSENELKEQLPLRLLIRAADGSIYEVEH